MRAAIQVSNVRVEEPRLVQVILDGHQIQPCPFRDERKLHHRRRIGGGRGEGCPESQFLTAIRHGQDFHDAGSTRCRLTIETRLNAFIAIATHTIAEN